MTAWPEAGGAPTGSGDVARRLLLAPAAALAGCTLLVHLAQATGLSFRGLSWLIGVVVTSAAGGASPGVVRAWRGAARREPGTLATLMLAGLLGAAAASFILMPHSDDVFYLHDARYRLEHPGEPMDHRIHAVHVDQGSIEAHGWGTSLAFEYTEAAVSYLSGIDLLLIYHAVAPALAGFLIVMALFYGASLLTGDARSAAVAALLTVGIVLLLGETHRSPGHFSFPRAQQGKVLLVALGLPLYAGLSFSYLARPSVRGWLALFVVATASVGLSSSAFMLLPPLAAILVVAHTAAERRLPARADWARFLRYGSTLLYLIAAAVGMVTYAVPRLAAGSFVHAGWPTTFRAQLAFVARADVPLTPVLAGGFAVLTLLALRGRAGRFVAAWIAAALLLFLNPLVAPLLITHLTTPNAYWRLFYLLPFPLVVTVGLALLWRRFVEDGRAAVSGAACGRRRTVTLGGAFGLIALGHWQLSATTVWSAQNRARVGWPGYKVSADRLEVARRVIALVPAGVMLAPSHLARPIVMLSSKFPQLALFGDPFEVWIRGGEGDAPWRRRVSAAFFVDGRARGDPAVVALARSSGVAAAVMQPEPASLLELVRQHDDLRAIVIADVALGSLALVADGLPLRGWLERQGFIRAEPVGSGYCALWR